MQQLKILFFFCTLLEAQCCYGLDLLIGHHQLLVVTALGWETKMGELQLYEREDDHSKWTPIGEPKPVVLGEAGLAWGLGLHPLIETKPIKVEADGKSPAGVFSLGSAFGLSPLMDHFRIEYLLLNENIEAIDDPLSLYYNQIVNKNEVLPDWQSSEKMGKEPLYELGLVVHHNFPHPQIGAGSAIFLHVWEHEDSDTTGCTAMSLKDLTTVLSWLEKEKSPVLLQLPLSKYHELQEDWRLPELKNQGLNYAQPHQSL